MAAQKPVDLKPVEQAISAIRIPEPDMSPVQRRIDAMETRLASFSLDPEGIARLL